MRQKYPERTIIILDTLGASSGYGLLTDAAADLRDNGATLEAAAQWVMNNGFLYTIGFSPRILPALNGEEEYLQPLPCLELY